jgi:hypothetical protein
MIWLWWIGAALVLVGTVSCGVVLGSRVSKGEAVIWNPEVLVWAIGFHGAVGIGGLMMIVQAKG